MTGMFLSFLVFSDCNLQKKRKRYDNWL